MTQAVVFSTPGLIPIESFTVFGMNAKPNSKSPFGFFGTGLKIAIAVCLRNNIEVVIWRGKDKYTFYTNQIDFRGKQFAKIRMKLERRNAKDILRKSYHDLPFTTELGKTWELWQAFREFESNTRDEGGRTYNGASLDTLFWAQQRAEESTAIVVMGQKFLDEYFDRGRNFLEDGLTERGETTGAIQVLDKPSKHVYYRGIRVMDLKEEAQFTYNFLKHVELTEDRTAKYPFLLESEICDLIMESEDKGFLDRTVGGSSSGYERNLSYSYTSARPSTAFISVAQVSPNVRAKEKAVEATTAFVPTTRITITVPKAGVSDEELHQLEEAVRNVWGDIKMEVIQ